MIDHLKDTIDLTTFGEWRLFPCVQSFQQARV
jgi:hypothetical protein